MMKSFCYLILLVVLLTVTGTKSQSDYEIDIQNDCESSPPPGVSNKKIIYWMKLLAIYHVFSCNSLTGTFIRLFYVI